MSGVIKIDQKITGQKIVEKEVGKVEVDVPEFQLETMHENIVRPDRLFGSTYKIKPPNQPGGIDHALYITINDIMLNAGTDHEQRVPYEIFLNSKAMESFQWIVGITRVLSAIFRKGGDSAFLIDELCSVFDPRGGYFKKSVDGPSKYIPSTVAEIGEVIKMHLEHIGVVKKEVMPDHVRAILNEKRAEFEAVHGKSDNDYPEQSVLCNKCGVVAAVMMGGCMTCLHCGDSKCG